MKEKEFYITSTITVMANSKEELDEKIILEKYKTDGGIAWELLNNAEIDQAPEE